MPTWNHLPSDIHLMILKELAQHGRLSPYATISREWQTFIEKRNFRRLKLKPSYLGELEHLSERRRGLAKHIWLNIELLQYAPHHTFYPRQRSGTRCRINQTIIEKAISRLFRILSAWKSTDDGGLTLELNTYSLSDTAYILHGCYIGAQNEDDTFARQSQLPVATYDIQRNWERLFLVDNPLQRPYEAVNLEFYPHLPQVKVVTGFIVRRQCRRQWAPHTLRYLWAKLPRLEHIAYEPWQLFNKRTQQQERDPAYWAMIDAHLPQGLKKLSIFEDFNQDHITLSRRNWLSAVEPETKPDRVRIPTPAVGAAFAARSLELEQLSVAFMADARDFFDARQPQWRWENLRSLVLTSVLMTRSSKFQMFDLLRDAAEAARCMPKLQTMVLWNGAVGEACAFAFCKEYASASIAWRGTWELKLRPDILQAWTRVADESGRYQLRVETELVQDSDIPSHGYAVHYLNLPSFVVDPVSLKQIQRETRGRLSILP
ncbi:hypothetical protein B0T10DRAFT_559966 [Thelonectria olida]|uniref:DUF6546 domain-containing protein n=1 Tax=Thelonectria olida TaxID=1576542 RepID=A0A9P9AS72_9HYPO|nr:hypothetical protein B0T10DRAFT_559966 [Thelonectria olida]